MNHAVERVHLPIALESVDRMPLEIVDVGIGHRLPVGVAQDPRREVEDEVIGHKVVVRDHVGGKVAEVAEDEGSDLLISGFQRF